MKRCRYLIIVYNADTMELVSVVNPEFDFELNDPALIKSDDVNVRLAKFFMERGDLPDMLEWNDVQFVLEKARKHLECQRKYS